MLYTLLSLALAIPSSVQIPLARSTVNLNPYPNKPRLYFRPNDGYPSIFRVTVYSDLHFGENPWDVWGPQQDVNSTKLINKVLSSEMPDYVVLNGDLITGENTFKDNSTKLIDEIVKPFNAAKVPFSSTYGNHDNQVNITHAAELKRELMVAPLSYTRASPAGVGGPGGPANYWVPVYPDSEAKNPNLIMWFFDSQGGFKTDGTPMPDWVDSTVATWLGGEVDAMDRAWGTDGREHIVFVHIPPSVMQKLQVDVTSTTNPGLNADVLGDGSTESSTTPLSSCGTNCDIPFWNSLNDHLGSQNIIGVVSGHDHGDEWCATETTKNVVFCFDKHSGYGGYSSTGWDHGVRHFVFVQDPTTKKLNVRTWIRYEGGSMRANYRLDGGGKFTILGNCSTVPAWGCKF